MNFSIESQDFTDGFRRAQKFDLEHAYTHYFLSSYLKSNGDSRYSKSNALRLALGETDIHVINYDPAGDIVI